MTRNTCQNSKAPRIFQLLLSCILAGLLLLPTQVDAQATGSVSGRILEAATEAPISLVQVVLPDLGLGTLARNDGRFLIVNVPVGTHEIRVERLGFGTATQQITVGAGQVVEVNFQLDLEVLGLDEIVITGTAGQARRREVGNTIAQIRLDDVIEPVMNVENLLQGRATGVMILQGSGQLGDAARIRLRGDVSNALGNQPLIYIDGIRTKNDGYDRLDPISQGSQYGTFQTSSPLNDINPSDIDRIEIIKGPAATTLYGAEAASGVIQIFTKQGRTGAPVWTAEINQGFVSKNKYGSENTIRGVPLSEINYVYPHGGTAEYNGHDSWMRKGWRQRYSLGVRGGTQDLRYFISGTLENNQGMFQTESEQRVSIRGNFGIRLTDQLNLDWNTSFSNNLLNSFMCGNTLHGVCINAARSPTNYISSGRKEDLDILVFNKDATSDIGRLITGATLRYQPTANFTNRLTVGYDRADFKGRFALPLGHISQPFGLEATSNSTEELLTLDFVSSYNLDISEGFGADLSFGGQSITSTLNRIEGQSEKFAGQIAADLITLNLGALTLARESRQRIITGGFFGQALFKYQDKYFLTLGLRVDGSSAFGGDFGLQPYPKVSMSYVISDEDFWPESFGQMKLRGAFGKAGRAPGAFDAVRTWTAIPWGGQSAFLPDNSGNPNLGPENTGEYDVGFESAWWNGRFVLDYSYYYRKTTDALVEVTRPASAGGFDAELINLGALEGRGQEISFSVIPIQTRSLTWELGVDYSTNHSKILDLGEQNAGSAEIGQPIRSERRDIILNPDEIAEPILDKNVRVGPNLPTTMISPRMSLRLPGEILIAVRGEYNGGHFIRDGATRWALATGGALPLCAGTNEDIAAGNISGLTATERQVCIRANLRSRVFVYSGDFFKLREVSVQIPLDRVIPGVDRASLTLSGRNLYRWVNDEWWNWDPEQTGWGGADAASSSMWEHPGPPKTFTASVQVSY